MIDRDRVLEALWAAFAEGYHLGYGNGRYDEENGEEHDTTFGEAFDEWLQGEGDEPPFPELTGRGPLFEPEAP